MNIFSTLSFKLIPIKLIPVIFVLCALMTGCRKPEPGIQRFEFTEEKMGTFVTITIYDKDRARSEKAAAAAYKAIDEVNAVFSRYDKDSELSRINEAVAGTVDISPLMAQLTERSIQLCRDTGFAFDITMGPMVALWRQARESESAPSEEDIRAAMTKTGCHKLEIGDDKKQLTLKTDGMSLDFGGIAKGYATARAAEAIRRAGVTSALINAGGDITTVGSKPGNEPWATGIRNPRDADDYIAKVFLDDQAIATSGDYEQYFMNKGKRESHIVDPRTGHGADATISATVVADDATLADALATALSVLGPGPGIKLIEKKFPSAHALIITPDRKLHYSKGFKKYMNPAL